MEIPRILASLEEDDIFIITADHGNDPTTVSTDHSREFVPLIVYGKNSAGKNLEIRGSFADIGATVVDYLCDDKIEHGTSFLGKIL